MGFKFGVSDDLMSNKQWHKSGMSTFASVMYDGGRDLVQCELLRNLETQTYGKEHAEDVFLRIIPNYIPVIPVIEGRKHIFLNVSKSPCMDKCAPNLINFVGQWPVVKLTVIVRGLYKGSEESRDAVDLMIDAGIVVSSDHRLHDPRTARFEV